jgi:hypothetical protein
MKSVDFVKSRCKLKNWKDWASLRFTATAVSIKTDFYSSRGRHIVYVRRDKENDTVTIQFCDPKSGFTEEFAQAFAKALWSRLPQFEWSDEEESNLKPPSPVKSIY